MMMIVMMRMSMMMMMNFVYVAQIDAGGILTALYRVIYVCST